ncbi:MAG: hypothetical protein V1726_06255 [Methanobacteriota archaeon]
MNINHPSQNIQKPTTTSMLVQILRPDIIIYSGIRELDRLLGGFKAGELTLIDGNSDLIGDLPNHLCVNTYNTFQSDTIYIDGGMCADPYTIARYARMMERDQREALRHVQISRAFTVYQLSTLIDEMLEPMIQQRTPRTLIIGMFPLLYHDPDVSSQEAQMLLTHNLEKIRELTRRYHLITVLTNLDVTPLSTHRGVGRTLFNWVDEIVRMKQRDQCTSIELVKKQTSTLLVRFSKEQRRLEEFEMVV